MLDFEPECKILLYFFTANSFFPKFVAQRACLKRADSLRLEPEGTLANS